MQENSNFSLANTSYDSYIRALVFLYHVAETGSPKKAAELLGVKPDTISKSLKKNLTKGGNGSLTEIYVKHGPGSLNLTHRGFKLLKLANEHIQFLAKIENEANSYDYYKNDRTFNIAVTPIYNIGIAQEFISSVLNVSPSVVNLIQVTNDELLELIYTNKGRVSELLSDDSIDMFLGGRYPYRRKSGIVSLGSENWKLLFSADLMSEFYDADEDEVTVGQRIDLKSKTLFSNYRFAFTDYHLLRNALDSSSFEVSVVNTNDNYQFLLDLIRQSEVVSIVPESVAVHAHTTNKDLYFYADVPRGLGLEKMHYCAYFSPANVGTDSGKYLSMIIDNIKEYYFPNQ